MSNLNGYKKFLNWLKVNNVYIILFAIIIIGAYLRLSDFSNLARFNADQVRDTKIVEAMIEKGQFPLLGPKAGGTTFNLGPAFYYLEYFSGLVFGNTPEGIAFIIPILGVASIYIFFLLFRFYFSANVSLVLTLLYATSYYAIRYTRFAWNPNAIPFFLFVFLWAILKLLQAEKEKRLKWNILLALTMGIAMQLHTTLFILMPLIFLAAHTYTFLKERKIPILNIAATLLVILFLHTPFFLHDIRNNGENISSFFQGAGSKTEKNSSLLNNLLLDGQFFFQGNTYALSGQEPEKNWIRPLKLVASKNVLEIYLFSLGIMFFIIGFILALKELKEEKNKQKKEFLMLITFITSLSFILFLPIAKELNLRFFMILIFLPFFFFGVIADFIFKKVNRKFAFLLVVILALGVSIANISSYKKTYDLENYQAKESVYGGISLGEAKGISKFISSSSQKNSDMKPFLMPFEFERSVEYILSKENIKIESFSIDALDENPLVFLITEKNKTENELLKYSDEFDLKFSDTLHRFTVSALVPKNQTYKIGFITDIHAKLKKDLTFNPQTKDTLETFNLKMNEIFKPDLVLQNGDFIDGTNREGEKSLRDIRYLTQHFSKLNFPFYNVLGNHDLRGLTKQQWLQETKLEKPYYHIEKQNLSAYVLSGNDTEDNGDDDIYDISESQFKWLEKEFASDNNLRKIVFVHYPVEAMNLAPGDKTLPLDDRDRLKHMFSKYGVMGVFSGHIEKLELNEIDGVRYFVIPGMERSENKLVTWYDSYAEVTIKENIEVDFYYKKDRSQKNHQTLHIPSSQFENTTK
ncbi:MAG: metallophosphoesterase [uncultured bacterium]|nr:MAG: metallophosphoesterase [uncultured bacterium]